MKVPAGPKVETVDDTVWLARFDGSWRVAKLSEVARAASFSDTRADEEPPLPGDDDPQAMPDVAAEQRAFAERVERFREVLADHEASYDEPGAAESCDGGVSVNDPEGDQPGADLAGVDVSVEGDSVCVRWRFFRRPDPPLGLSYNHYTGPDGPGFDVEIREDGTARMTSGEDDDGRPIVVLAEIGVSDTAVSAVFTPDTESPEPLGFSVSVSALVGGESVGDELSGPEHGEFRYSDGKPCPLEGC
jgi:hypothetical protein